MGKRGHNFGPPAAFRKSLGQSPKPENHRRALAAETRQEVFEKRKSAGQRDQENLPGN